MCVKWKPSIWCREKASALSKSKEVSLIRANGILMHLSSVPSPYGIGTMGQSAREFIDFLKEANNLKPDALIISDPGAFTLAKKYAPQIPIHISTQANNTNYGTYLF